MYPARRLPTHPSDPARDTEETTRAGLSIHELVVISFSNGLADLIAELDRANEDAVRRGAPTQGVLDARLAPHMNSLAEEIGLACTQARLSLARLFGDAPPQPLRTDTYARARDAIETTLADLWECDRNRLEASARHAVSFDLPRGETFDLSGRQYVRDWAVPQFHLHLVAARMILRAQGLRVDQVSPGVHMCAYLRPSARDPGGAV
jgi:hypothetical protein